MRHLGTWFQANCKFAQKVDHSLWHTPKFEKAVQMVEAYNNINNFNGLANSITKLLKAVQSKRDIPKNREYAAVMSALAGIDSVRATISPAASAAKKTADEGGDVNPYLQHMQKQAQQVPALLDKVLQSIQSMGKRTNTKPAPAKAPMQPAPARGQQPVMAQMHQELDAQPYIAPDEWESLKPDPVAPAPAAPPAMPAPRKPMSPVNPNGKPAPIVAPTNEPMLPMMDDPVSVYNEVIPLIHDVQQKAQAAMQIHEFNYGAQLDRMEDLFEKGKSGLNWYDNIAKILDERIGKKNTPLFLKFVAATSPRMPVMRNLEQAIKAYNQYMSGQEYTGFMRTHLNNILKSDKGEDLSGNKVNNFAKAMGSGPESENAVTLDVWMARAFGMNNDTFNDKQYAVLSDAVRELAAKAGVQPRQFQAAVWTGIKGEQNSTPTADPIDHLMDNMWGKFKQEFIKSKKPSAKPKVPEFQLSAGLKGWLKGNCKSL